MRVQHQQRALIFGSLILGIIINMASGQTSEPSPTPAERDAGTPNLRLIGPDQDTQSPTPASPMLPEEDWAPEPIVNQPTPRSAEPEPANPIEPTFLVEAANEAQPDPRISRLPKPNGDSARTVVIVRPKHSRRELAEVDPPSSPSKTPAAPPVSEESVARVVRDAVRQATHEVAKRPGPESRSQRLEREQLKNRLAGPLSGDFDFESPMEAVRPSDTSYALTPNGPAMLPPTVAEQARRMLYEATKLADRGAIYAANREFLRVMRMITQALDSQVGQQYHTRALAAGLRALEEADDFAVSAKNRVEDDVHLGSFVKGHRTPVLKGQDLSQMTSLRAIQSYYEYGREQLKIAAGNTALGSHALYALGRAESFLRSEGTQTDVGAPKSIAFYDAALQTDPTNILAGNELAVMLARRGRLRDAATILQSGLETSPNAMAATNLAKIYHHLGDPRGDEIQQVLVSPELQGPASRVTWVSPEAFEQASGSADSAIPSVAKLEPISVDQVNWNTPANTAAPRIAEPRPQRPFGNATDRVRSMLSDPTASLPMPRSEQLKQSQPVNPAPINSQWW